jgi:hypothetical protein
MRFRLFVSLAAVLIVALASVGATAVTASGKDKGKSSAAHENRGQQQKAATPSDSQHDPSNPDGTYRGKSSSTPDQDGIGADHGIDNNDKVGPETDGNNGCGNDPDREDDNNGWCGRKPSATPTATSTSTASPTVAPTETSGGSETEVLGETFKKPKPAAQVLGVGFARTGAAVTTLVLLALMTVVIGLGLRTIARPRRSD